MSTCAEDLSMYGCDTFVVLPPLTEPNGIIFGKNSDRPNGEIQEIVYYPGRTDIPAETKLQCTYKSIEEHHKTYAVILSKPIWMWGAEMGSNSAGVCIGNEAVWTKGPDPTEKKLLGMDLVRLGLERSGSAEEAVSIITSLLEKYGQGGPCSDTVSSLVYQNSFLIADSKEAWILETVDTHWIAEKVKDGFRNISNVLSITTDFDKISAGLKSYAIDENLWDGKTEFNFKKIFSTCGDAEVHPREAAGKKLLQEATHGKKFGVRNMFSILRDKESGICRSTTDSFVTTCSQVSLISESSSIHWFTGTPDPSLSVFKPFVFTDNVQISSHTVSHENQAPLLYKLHDNAVSSKPPVIDKLKEMEEQCTDEMIQFFSNPSSYTQQELDDLFKDIVETEIKFYK